MPITIYYCISHRYLYQKMTNLINNIENAIVSLNMFITSNCAKQFLDKDGNFITKARCTQLID